MEAYCFKCKTKRNMTAATPIFMANASPATTGTCEVCGGKLFKVGATPAHEGMQKPEPVAKAAKPKAAKAKAAPSKKAPASKTKKSTASSKSTASKTATAAATTTTKAAPKKSTAGKSTSKTASKSKKSTKSSAPVRRSGSLVIVESPAKAQSIGRYLGKGYTVVASKGHVRDLPKSRLSVDIENNFEPTYTVPKDKRATVNELKKAAEAASEIFLATDPDREGEAIAWHLIAAAQMEPERVKRVEFHEITEPAVKEAFAHPREVNMDLVNAQQARRVLDRLVGYQVSQVLWSKVRKGLSAGRVQSIALRLVVDRERQIENFDAQEYWTLEADLEKKPNGKKYIPFTTRLAKLNGEDPSITSEAEMNPHLEILKKSMFAVSEIVRGSNQRKPSPPFTTSTLQQEASKRLGFTARRTMSAAQQLYEGVKVGKEGVVGLITYMRTDSTSVSAQAQTEARDYVHQRFSKQHTPDKPPVYKTKAKGAQEAHEAVRPTKVARTPDSIRSTLTTDQYKLYKLIWERFVASQMSNAQYDTLRVDIGAGLTATDQPYLFRATSRVLTFAGFLALYEDTRDEDAAVDTDENRAIPPLNEKEPLTLHELFPAQHFTEPPPRYTEASLVKALEEFGIGRPSTYAPIMSVIQDRDYVETKQKRMNPTEIGKLVNDLLVQFFPDVLDYQFTAKMEDQLDSVAEGEREWQPVLHDFYGRFAELLDTARETMPKSQTIELVGRSCPLDGGDLIIKYGRFGKFIGCANFPECKHTEPFLERTGIICPKCGEEHSGELIQRKTRAGRTFYGCIRYPECDYSTWNLPKTKPATTEAVEGEVQPKPSRRRTAS
jgi:DNA topoisomerase-1